MRNTEHRTAGVVRMVVDMDNASACALGGTRGVPAEMGTQPHTQGLEPGAVGRTRRSLGLAIQGRCTCRGGVARYFGPVTVGIEQLRAVLRAHEQGQQVPLHRVQLRPLRQQT
jgi:hypothetical protein